jgi:NADP-dependent 3-hydroxy acid dehydrogenase YdfG
MNKPLIIITGASSGIGAALASTFSAAGHPLLLLARNREAMEALQLPHVICQSVDITDPTLFKQAIQNAEEKYGPVDSLINNAGIGSKGDFTGISHHDNAHMVELNIIGVINGIEIVLPGMQARKTGTIINISSLADRKERPKMAVYAATKAAIKSLSESLRMDNAPYGIRICNIAPAKISTPLSKTIFQNSEAQEMISAEDFAKTVLWIYQQPQNICIRDLVIAPTSYIA